MVMIRNKALLLLAAGLLMGAMAVSAQADYPDRDLYEPTSSSMSSDVEKSETHVDTGEIREPMETGAVPDRSIGSSEPGSGSVGDEPTVEFGGQSYRPSVDLGP